MPTYDRTIKLYATNGTTLVSTLTGVLALEYNLGLTGGCLGGSLTMRGTVRDDYALSPGQVVRLFYASTDTDPIYTGVVTRCEKVLAAKVHQYELAGLWGTLDAALTLDSSIYTGQTIAAIVADLFAEAIAPVCPLLDATPDIEAAVTLDEFTVVKDTPVLRYLTSLAVMASTEGAVVACGIDASGVFYFKTVSVDEADLQGTATIARTTTTAEEVGEPANKKNRLAVVGDLSKENGWRAKKTFTHASALTDGAGPLIPARVYGVRREADLTKFASGWFARYAEPGLQVSGLRRIPLQAHEAAPLPWAGQFRYEDHATGIVKTDYLAQARVLAGSTLELDLQIGLAGSGDEIASSDPYAPAELDGWMADDAWLDYPDATDLTEPPTDTPFQVTEDMLNDLIDPSGVALDTALTGLHVLSLTPTSGARVSSADELGDTVHVLVTLTNGGTALNTEIGPVVLYGQFYAEAEDGHHLERGDLVQTYAETLDRTGADGNIELWSTVNGFELPYQAGFLTLAVRVEVPEVSPAEYLWYPSDIADEGTDLPTVRAIDNIVTNQSTTQLTLYVGWMV
jgi:hypothetical protein